jgi:sigma-B regulation protein RsbU (phosphoserine phosphatase)
MNRYFRRSDVLMMVAGLAGLVYFILLYANTFPEAVNQNLLSREEIERRATALIRSQGLMIPDSLEQLHHRLTLARDQKQIRYLQELLGLREANKTMAGDMPAYTWRLRWYVISDNNFHIGNNTEENSSNDPEKDPDEKLTLQFDRSGRLIYFSCKASRPKNMIIPSQELKPPDLKPVLLPPAPVTADSARKIVSAFIQNLGWIDPDDFSKPEIKNSMENQVGRNELSQIQTNEFSFVSKSKKYGETISLKVGLQNSLVNFFDYHYTLPAEFVPMKDRALGKINDVADIIVIMVFSLAVIVFFFRQFRTGAFDIKLGVFFGVITFLTFGVMMFFVIGTDYWLVLFITILFGGSWWMLATGLVVAVSASLTHDAWPEKYLTFEAIRRFKILNRRSGLGLLRGFFFAGLLLGGVTAILHLIPGASFVNDSDSTTFALSDRLGSVFLICTITWNTLLKSHAVWLLTLSAFRKRISKNWILYVIGAAVGIVTPYMCVNAGPIAVRLAVGLVLGLVTTYVLLRYDFLTTVTMIFIADLLQPGYALIAGGDVYQSSALIIFLGVLFVTALLGTFSRESGEDILEYVPEYVKEIENKQRMQREFEIARHIQTNLLCRATPESDVFELASFCEAAYEVGGDYYDFIVFPDTAQKKLGVVIGDVSGKGVSAAFYSTLVKGIVQTQALITSDSAKKTLVRVNDVFYEQVQRGKFISMIYAIFDFDRKKVLLARAGHNPVLIKKSNENAPETLTPGGIAIGLTRGKPFEDALEEIEIPFKSNDVFVFYTDGFSEAMNRRGEEYGETRLAEIIQQNASDHPQGIIKTINNDVLVHTGSTPQHDDMTMIVVKVKP